MPVGDNDMVAKLKLCFDVGKKKRNNFITLAFGKLYLPCMILGFVSSTYIVVFDQLKLLLNISFLVDYNMVIIHFYVFKYLYMKKNNRNLDCCISANIS